MAKLFLEGTELTNVAIRFQSEFFGPVQDKASAKIGDFPRKYDAQLAPTGRRRKNGAIAFVDYFKARQIDLQLVIGIR